MPDVVKTRKKLIEVALPLEAINVASAREKSIRHGHPSTLHLWWARRPLAAARAVIFAQTVDDPSANPDLFPTEKAQEKERKRLFNIIEDLVKWENTNNEQVLEAARAEIWQSWRRTCADNADHPRAKELFNRHKLPAFHDPFCGGGALPLEAQRLGLEAYASDLNPVAVLITEAMIEIPPKFGGKPPVNPKSRSDKRLLDKKWHGAEGLAEDVRYYGQWMRDQAEKRIGRLYPKVEISAEMAKQCPDMKRYVGKKLTVIAWLWVRTVKSPNPAFANVDVPLASTFMLCTKSGKEAYVQPVIENGDYRFTVKLGKPNDAEAAKLGTTAGKRNAFRCLMSGVPITYEHIRAEGRHGRMGTRLMAVVAEGANGRVYLAPDASAEEVAASARPEWKPETELPANPRDFKTPNYGLTTFGDLFTNRQLVALTTFSDLVLAARDCVRRDTLAAGFSGLRSGIVPEAYADAVVLYLGFVVDKCSDYWSAICSWHNSGEKLRNTFGRQAIPMVWDYAEANPFSESSGNFVAMLDWTWKSIETTPARESGHAEQADAASQKLSAGKVISTDPPYYDNIGYAELSDFFYIWLRRSMRSIFPDLFATLTVPKDKELVATPYRHGSKEKAEAFFLSGMTMAMRAVAEQAHPSFPVTIYYAFKQSEGEAVEGTASTGWETFLDAAIRSGFAVSGTWPVRTELANKVSGIGRNMLASSIVLACRARAANAPLATRREFINILKSELPMALAHLQRGNIAPVDLAQAAIGPGMAVYTRFSKVVDADGKVLPVREALSLINQMLDEVLSQQEGDFDSDTRWALTWFEDVGFAEGEFGKAEQLSKSKNISMNSMVQSGFLFSKSGKVRLKRPQELAADWTPLEHSRLTVWESVHHVIRRLEKEGEASAAELVRLLGGMAEVARELAYRLYVICDRKKRPQEALSYNGLVQSWPEIMRLVRERAKPRAEQAAMFAGE